VIRAVGLTGGIGSGKSTVAALFARHGVLVIDTDAIAHRLTAAGGVAIPAIRAAFGDAVLAPDGALDRAAMRRRVFADANARKRLEAILHPLIRQQVERELARLEAQPYAIVVIPLLVETAAYGDLVERILVVDCDEASQVERVCARNGLALQEVEAIMAAQASRAQRLAVADDVIDNTGDGTALAAQVDALHRKYLGLFRAP
jgi:dephospho-CoA kinase